MAKTNAERQAEYRARMKAKGFKQKLIWFDYDDHFVWSDSPANGLGRKQITVNQLAGRLKEITEGMDEKSMYELFAEIADHAKRLRARMETNEEVMKMTKRLTVRLYRMKSLKE